MRKLGLGKLWVRLTLACTLVILVALTIASTLSLWGLRRELEQYVEGNYGSVPEGISRQLAAYYQQRNQWDGVQVLLENDFPLSLVETLLIDTDGNVIYDSRGEERSDPLPSAERSDLWPIVVDEQVVGYWGLSFHSVSGPKPPEQILLRGIERLVVFLTILVTTTGLIVGGVLTRSLTIPLRRLVAATQAVATGDLGRQVEESGSDEIVQVAHAFNEMTAALEKTEELRQDLMADVAHELRTPLSVVQGNLRAILDDVYPLEKVEIARLYDETRLLSRLVDDLRELAQAEAGQLSLNLRATDLAELLHFTVTNFEPAAECKEIHLSLEVANALPAIEADPDRLAQVLRNLLANALRHTPIGGWIAVSASLAPGYIRVAVADNGRGIEPQHLESVFDRFWRTDRSRSRESGGSGLGLAIAKSLVEAHGGRIWAESAPGQGATFTFELPVEPDTRQMESR